MAVLPVFLKVEGRRVLVVGGGRVAAAKVRPLLDAGARVTVVAPEIQRDIRLAPVETAFRPFSPRDLDDVCYAVAAAPRHVNAEVAREAAARKLFVNAVDDVEHATAYAGAVLQRAGVTVAISTDGAAPALAGLLREALDDVLPPDLEAWMIRAKDERVRWLAAGVPMQTRRPLLLDALVRLYGRPQ